MKSNVGTVTNGHMRALKNRISDLEPLFGVNKHEEFTVRDLEYERDNLGSVLDFAVSNGAIEKIDQAHYRRECDTRRRYINMYTWNPDVYDELQEYRKQQDTLPCGHRVHILNSKNVPEDKLSCRYCAKDDEYPVIDKDTVRDLL